MDTQLFLGGLTALGALLDMVLIPSHRTHSPSLFPLLPQVDTQFFFSGPPWEYATRQLAALALNTAHDMHGFNASNSLYAHAVEGIGFLQVMS